MKNLLHLNKKSSIVRYKMYYIRIKSKLNEPKEILLLLFNEHNLLLKNIMNSLGKKKFEDEPKGNSPFNFL